MHGLRVEEAPALDQAPAGRDVTAELTATPITHDTRYLVLDGQPFAKLFCRGRYHLVMERERLPDGSERTVLRIIDVQRP